MLLSVVPDEAELDAYRDLKSRGAVDGVIIHAVRIGDPRLAALREIGLPFVVHGRSTGETGEYAWVDVNNRRAFLRATEFLLDLGHRRIALVNGVDEMDFAMRRRTGYLDALAARGLTGTFGLYRRRTDAGAGQSAHRLSGRLDAVGHGSAPRD
jgi:LacI family transcriptional regulator